MSMLPADDPRWDARVTYTNDDDGVWLLYGEQRIRLGFDPTVWEVVAGMEALKP